ncbi:hypothetical protein [Veillonella ratti]|uniref:hypothetical protein n=1 Tax=Veillonella ratti TaxID=103892 RepID=UPI000F8EE466|nr:hypothetical protein [Veillonella ratti]
MHPRDLSKFIDACYTFSDYILRIKQLDLDGELKAKFANAMNRFAGVYHLIIEDAIQTQTRLAQPVEAELLEIGYNMSEEARELDATESQERIIKDTQLYIYFFFPEIDIETLDLATFCQRGKTRYS